MPLKRPEGFVKNENMDQESGGENEHQTEIRRGGQSAFLSTPSSRIFKLELIFFNKSVTKIHFFV